MPSHSSSSCIQPTTLTASGLKVEEGYTLGWAWQELWKMELTEQGPLALFLFKNKLPHQQKGLRQVLHHVHMQVYSDLPACRPSLALVPGLSTAGCDLLLPLVVHQQLSVQLLVTLRGFDGVEELFRFDQVRVSIYVVWVSQDIPAVGMLPLDFCVHRGWKTRERGGRRGGI